MIAVLVKAAKIVGGVSQLAKEVGAPRTAMYAWNRIPDRFCVPLYHATNGAISFHEMRKDIYPKNMRTKLRAKKKISAKKQKSSATN